MEPVTGVGGASSAASAADRKAEVDAFMAEGMIQVGVTIMSSLGQDLTSSLGSTWDD